MWWFCIPSAGIFKQSMGARHRVGIGLSFQPARLHRLAEWTPRNRFLGSLNFKNSGTLSLTPMSQNILVRFVCMLHCTRRYKRGNHLKLVRRLKLQLSTI